MTFGSRVRDIRKQKNITQEKLAKKLDFSHASAISFIENGKRRLDAEKDTYPSKCTWSINR
ncbi:helix-turn-helix domain-containing protein [Bacillus paranthracis]